MAGQVWEYTQEQLLKLTCTRAKVTLWNGGDSIGTVFTMKNRAGFSRDVHFAGDTDGGGHWGALSCDPDIKELRIQRRSGGGSEVSLRTTGSEGLAGWAEHFRLVEQYFSESAIGEAQVAVCETEIELIERRVIYMQSTLKQVEEI
jgi:hypothetical protein